MVRSLDRIVAGGRSGLEQLATIGYDEPTTTRLRDLIAQRCDELAG